MANGYDAHARRAAAHQQLTLAHETFEAIGARSFVERARAGLRSSEPAGRRTTPDSERLLTSRELTIAELAAAGHLNRVIARCLFVSEKTVEYPSGRAFPSSTCSREPSSRSNSPTRQRTRRSVPQPSHVNRNRRSLA